MLKFLLGKFKEAPGPFKQTRLIAGDLAEEVLDLVTHYLERRKEYPGSSADLKWDSPEQARAKSGAAGSDSSSKTSSKSKKETAKKSAPKPELKRTVDVPEELEKALSEPKNKKKQEFKILAILWDANERNLGTLSAKGVSERGVLLGLAIRHENVRKVIRMRLGKYVETLTEQIGNNRIYRYKISSAGGEYFASKYLN